MIRSFRVLCSVLLVTLLSLSSSPTLAARGAGKKPAVATAAPALATASAVPATAATGATDELPDGGAASLPTDERLVKVESLLGEVEEVRAEAKRLEIESSKAKGESKLLLDDQLVREREKLRRAAGELVEALGAAAELGADLAAATTVAKETLTAESTVLRTEIRAVRESLATLRRTRADAEPADWATVDRDVAKATEALDAALHALLENAQRMLSVGLDAADDTAFLDEVITSQAQETAAFIELTLDQIKDLRERPAPLDDDEKVAREKEARDLDSRVQAASESLTRLVELMKERELDASEYQQLLIRATGDLTKDILDAEVAVGLLQRWMQQGQDWLVERGPTLIFKALLFGLILVLFWVAARIARRLVRGALKSSSRLKLSKLLEEFFISMTGRLVNFLGILIALSQLGIEMGPLLAGLGVAGFVIGFALQSTLSNFAAGLMILIYRPYDVGDLVEVSGATGTVAEMSLVSTTIRTLDNQRIVVPNNKVWGDVIKNVTAEDTRRVDLVFGVGYGDDLAETERVLREIVGSHPLVMKDPEPVVQLHNLGDSSVDFVVRPWCKTGDYWNVYWDMTRTVKDRFDAEGISIPFPQRDVHLYRESSDGASAS